MKMSELFLTLAMFWKILKFVLDDIYLYVFDNLIHLHDVASNCVSLLLPSTCYVFDFISVSIYVGLEFWICVSFLNSRFFTNLIGPWIFIYEMLLFAFSHCFYQRIVFLISFVFPITVGWRFGSVCLFLYSRFCSQIDVS